MYESGIRVPRDGVKIALGNYFGVNIQSPFLTTMFTLSEHPRAWHERRKRKSCGARTPQPGGLSRHIATMNEAALKISFSGVARDDEPDKDVSAHVSLPCAIQTSCA